MRRMRYFLGFCGAMACAALLYGLSVRFSNPLTAALSPVNGSPWESGKLALWPELCAVLLLRRLDDSSSRSGLCAAVLLSCAAAIGLSAVGIRPVPLCAASAAAGLLAYALVLRKLRGGELLWYAALLLLAIAFLLFTILPPCGPLFTDGSGMPAADVIPF